MNQKITYKINGCLLCILLAVCLLSGQANAEAVNVNNASHVVSQQQSSYKHFSSDADENSSCAAYFKGSARMLDCRHGEVPFPAAVWLFLLALVAFVGLSNKKKV